jgi:intein-encoded DNA endonuclease-like protein
MNDLLKNIDKLHTTELGIIRIKKNLELNTDDVVNWCKKKTKNADDIVKNGKNWYVYIGDNVITINAKSYTIITAHKVKNL